MNDSKTLYEGELILVLRMMMFFTLVSPSVV